MNCVLIVEDDPAILRGLTDNLRSEAYEVLSASDGEAGYRLIREKKPDLIILDVMLPKLGGFELCRKVRGEGVTTPILMLTARSTEADRVLGFDLGADDYVTKPFSLKELLARVRATFRQRETNLADRARLDHEIRVASEVQQRLFPQHTPPLSTLEYGGFCQPAAGVGGDYYDFLPLSPKKMGLVVADVSGKGISAALLTASLHAFLRTNAGPDESQCEDLISRANDLLYACTTEERYATVFYGVYDETTRRLTYVNAGHEPPMLVRHSDRSHLSLDSSGPPVGMFPSLPVERQDIQLEANDWLLIFSDGVTDAVDEDDGLFGRQRLAGVVATNSERNVEQMCQAVRTEIMNHCGTMRQWDDLTLIAARVR